MTETEAQRVYALYKQEEARLAHVRAQQNRQQHIDTGLVALDALPFLLLFYLVAVFASRPWYRRGYEWPVVLLFMTGIVISIELLFASFAIQETVLDLGGRWSVIASACLTIALGLVPTIRPDLALPCYGLLAMFIFFGTVGLLVACGIHF
jgi:hypothetical protein